MEACTKQAADFAHRTTIDKVGFIIPNHLLNIVNPRATFCLHEETIASISIDRSNINKSVLGSEKSLISCFVEFNNYMFYITRIDVFLYNNVHISGCAYGLGWCYYWTNPYAITINKSTTGRKFYEFKVQWGFFKFLAVAGYHGIRESKFTPFSGSFMKDWRQDVVKNGKIYTKC